MLTKLDESENEVTSFSSLLKNFCAFEMSKFENIGFYPQILFLDIIDQKYALNTDFHRPFKSTNLPLTKIEHL